jgi:hypothetical protein
MRIGWKVPAITAAAVAAGFVGGMSYAKTANDDYVIMPAGTQKYAPVDPKNPKGPEVAVLKGDLKTGPVAFFLKLPKGPAPLHWHTSDYYAVTIQGDTKHWLPGKEAEAKSNPPGTSWFQPGGKDGVHGDECLSDSCVVFIFMPKKFDFTPAPAPKTPAPKK